MHADPKNTLHVPDEWLAKFSFIKDSLLRRQYHAMVAYMDEVVGNVTTQLKTKGMWENVSSSPPFPQHTLTSEFCRQTLIVSSSDNGGPIYAGGDLTVNEAGYETVARG